MGRAGHVVNRFSKAKLRILSFALAVRGLTTTAIGLDALPGSKRDSRLCVGNDGRDWG